MPDEIYNLGAQSHVGVSFENPVYTSEVTGLGSLRILEVIRSLNLKKKSNFIKPLLLSYLVKKREKMFLTRNPNLIPNPLTVRQSFLPII